MHTQLGSLRTKLKLAGIERLFCWNGTHCYALLLAGFTFALYLPAISLPFSNFDDPAYLFYNSPVRTGISVENLKWALMSLNAEFAYWHPLSWWSHMLDAHLFGMKPGPHHMTNVLIHVLNTVLLFSLTSSLTGFRMRAAIVAMLFAVHPTNVESVVWVAERKNLLSTSFALLALLAYGKYARSLRLRDYIVTLTLYLLSLMAKPMMVTFPLLLLLFDYWPLKRINEGRLSLIYEKIPFCLLALGVSAVTLFAQNQVHAMWTFESLPVSTRMANAVVSIFRYAYHLICPVSLALFYPHPVFWSQQIVLSALIAFVSITAFVIKQRLVAPYMFVGWLWFALSLMPIIGIIQVGGQAMADRYTYVPYLGLYFAIVWHLAVMSGRWRIASRAVLLVLTTAWVGWTTMRTREQISLWETPLKIWVHSAHVTQENTRAKCIVADLLVSQRRYSEAIPYLLEARSELPQDSTISLRIAEVNIEQGEFRTTRNDCIRASQNPELKALAEYELGVAAEKQQKLPESCRHYEAALSSTRPCYKALLPLATIYTGARDSLLANPRRALSLARKAVIVLDDFIDTRRTLAIAYAANNNYSAATEHAGAVFDYAKGMADVEAFESARKILLALRLHKPVQEIVRGSE